MAENNFNDIWRILGEYQWETDEINSEFICTICKGILINPFHGPCGCRFCRECIAGYLNGNKRYCPADMGNCRDEMISLEENLHLDTSVSIRIGRIIVKCPQKCEFKSQLKKIGDHILSCKENSFLCPYSTIGCKKRNSVQDKMCDHLRSDIYEHSILLIESMNHLKNEMESLKKHIIDLRNGNISQNEEIRLIKIAISALTAATNGLRVGDIVALNEDMVAVGNINRAMRQEIEALKIATQDEQTTISGLQTQMVEQASEMAQWQHKWEQMALRFGDIERAGEKDRMALSARIDAISQSCTGMSVENIDGMSKANVAETAVPIVRIHEPVEDVQQMTNHVENKVIEVDPTETQEFVWNIEKWSEKEKLAKAGTNQNLFSDPFYSHKNGYKMCLRVDPAEIGVFRVYFYFMLGPFDDNLQWPFNHNVVLTIIDPHTRLPKESRLINVTEYPNSKGWNRPINDRNDPIRILWYTTKNELRQISARHRNDRVSLKCTVNLKRK